MKQQLRITLLLFLFCATVFGQSLQLSDQAQASVLTMGPGEQLYDSFGHSAIRIHDPQQGIDIVYNYGVYDFSDPNFYTKFARGKLLYLLVRRDFESFVQSYKNQQRWVKEQILELTGDQRQALLVFLENNAKPENRAYKYDFFYDNCATKIIEVLERATGAKITIPDSFIEQPKTFRTLVQDNVHWNTWGSLGMDVAIGSVTDVKATAREHLFLPLYVYDALKVATIATAAGPSRPLVIKTNNIHEVGNKSDLGFKIFGTPLFVFVLIALLILLVTFIDYKKQKRSRWLDVTLAIITGVAGILLVFLWFATDHSTTANNYNLLWAFPFNLFIILQLAKKQPKKWLGRYMRFLVIMLVLLTMHWIIGVQVFAKAFIPLFIALVLRYIYVIKYLGSLPPVEDNGA